MDNHFFRMQLASSSSDGQVTNDGNDNDVHADHRDAIESESDFECLKDCWMMEEVLANSKDSMINSVDRYQYFTTICRTICVNCYPYVIGTDPESRSLLEQKKVVWI